MGKRVVRFGETIDADAVYDAWTSGDFDRMRAALHIPTNLVERDCLLATFVEQLYRRRADPAVRRELFEVGAIHLQEMQVLRAAARAHRIAERECTERHIAERAARHRTAPMELPPFDPNVRFAVATFGALGLAYCEIGEYESARDVWRVAHRVGYVDDGALELEFALIDKRRHSTGHPNASA